MGRLLEGKHMSKIKELFVYFGVTILVSSLVFGFLFFAHRQERNTRIAEASRPRSVISPDGLVVDGCTVRTETVTRTTFLAPDGATVLVVEQVNETIKPRSNP